MTVAMTLFVGAEVYAPEPIGRNDVMVVGETIVAVGPELGDWANMEGVERIDASHRLLTPGFIDQHVHIHGGGGGMGFGSRAPEVRFSECMCCGTTTVVGCHGIDTMGRDPLGLVGKARSLKARGMSAYVFIGGFDHPPVTVTGDLKRDIYLIEEVIGAGETALSDWRSGHPGVDDLKRLASQCLVAGRVSGKAGLLHLHLGDNKTGIQPLFSVLDEGEIPIQYICPTHFNRNEQLIQEAPEWAARGGAVDLTTALRPPEFKRAMTVTAAVFKLREAKVPASQITISTDGNGVSTLGGPEHIRRFPLKELHDEIKSLVREEVLSLDEALATVTSNVAAVTKLSKKGRIAPGADADILLLDPETLDIDVTMARGQMHVRNGRMMYEPRLDC